MNKYEFTTFQLTYLTMRIRFKSAQLVHNDRLAEKGGKIIEFLNSFIIITRHIRLPTLMLKATV